MIRSVILPSEVHTNIFGNNGEEFKFGTVPVYSIIGYEITISIDLTR